MRPTPDSIRVLHVDDDPDLADVAATFLEREDDRFDIEAATSASEGLDRLAVGDFDCVISDYEMPGRNGIEFLRAVRSEYPDLPFILYTGKGSEAVASDAISAGVTDYLQKESGTSQYAVLANRIGNAVEQYRAKHEVEASQKRLSLFFEQSPLGVIEWDDEFDVARVNDAAEDILGYPEAELVGRSWEAIVPESDREQVGDVVEDLLEAEGGFHSVNENVRKGGERIVCEWHNRVVTDDSGETIAIFSQFRDITGRKERERELERYEAYLQESTDIITVLDESGTIKYESPSVTRILGYDSGELIGRNGFDFIHPDDVNELLATFDDLLSEPEATVTAEYRFRTADGEWRWLEVRGTNQLDHDAINGVVTNNRDITDRKERERELRRYERIVNTMQEAACIYDEDGRFVVVNGYLADFYGTDPAELLGEESSLIPMIREEWEGDPYRELLDGKREEISGEVAGEFPGRGYEVLSYRLTPLVIDGSTEGAVSVAREITERKERERRLEALNETTRELMAADTREEIAETGVRAARDVLGLAASAIHLHEEGTGLVPVAQTDASEELVGEAPMFTGGDSIAWSVYESGEALALDDVTEHPDVYNPDTPVRSELYLPIGEYGIMIVASGTPEAFDQQDVVLGEILTGHIATALEQVERTEQLRARKADLTRQNERLEEFASVVSHDLRNPLQLAKGRLDLAREDADSEHLESIDYALDRMDRIVEDVLWLAREGRDIGSTEPVALGDAVASAWAVVADGVADAELRYADDVDECHIEADRDRLGQLLENLLRNAVEHAGEGVTVTVGELEGGFYVADDGPGIPEEERETVFDAGHSQSGEGTGFGLNIVRQVAAAHGWDVRITESSAGGARLEFTGVSFVE